MEKNEKEKFGKNFFIAFLALALFLFSFAFVSADSYQLVCPGQGESIDFGELCNPAMDSRTGPGNICVHILDNGRICPANPNVCNSLGLVCSPISNSTTSVDGEPPELEIISPLEGQVFSSRSAPLNLKSNERADIYFLDLINGQGRWSRVCTSCRSYDKLRSFNEGLNQLMFRATDRAGNARYVNDSFFIDSKSPRIRSTEPRKGYASGIFEVQFQEDNPKTLTLFYGSHGNGDGVKSQTINSKNLNIENECSLEKGKMFCSTNVDIRKYDGVQIEYWFQLSDIVNNTDSSKRLTLNVDGTFPIINSLNYTIDKKRVEFQINITEKNFKEASYMDLSDRRPRWRKLCSKLKDGICEKRITFRQGIHDVSIQVIDEAGNSAGQSISFSIL